MFSQVFNRAKGIFSKKDLPANASEDSSGTVQGSQSDSTDSTDTAADMVVTTRQGHAESRHKNGSDSMVNGKRKTRDSNTNNTNGNSSKRRRISSEQNEDIVIEELSSSQPVPEDNVVVEIPEIIKKKVAKEVDSQATTSTSTSPNKTSNHIRFGSEEPALPIRTAKENEDHEAAITQAESEDDDDDDDDAPEVVDNSAQLLSLKVQAQKQKEAKRR